ncbi:unnamed protein product [Scytosiphon promiscuus]
MPSALSPQIKAMVIISAAYCLIFGSVAGGASRRMTIKRKHCCQHFPAFFSAAFLSLGSTSRKSSTSRTLPCRPRPKPHRTLPRRNHTCGTAKLDPGADRLQRRGATCTAHNDLVSVACSGRSRVRSRRCWSAHADPADAPVSHVSRTSGAAAASNVVVLASIDNNRDVERCRRLAQNLGISLVLPGQDDGPEREEEDVDKQQQQAGRGTVRRTERGGAGREKQDFKFTLMFDESGRLALGQPGSGFNPLAVDFSRGKTGHRSKHQQGKEQVVKAAALPKRRTAAAFAHANKSAQAPFISNNGGGSKESDDDVAAPLPVLWDLTAGLGTDAFLLAQAGWRVEMFERSPVVAALVQDALDRARLGEDETARTAAFRMSLTVADSVDALEAGVAAENREDEGSARPDVVYLDPMFPQHAKGKKKAKSALAKKGMQMLQALLEEEDTGDDSGRRGLENALHDGNSESDADDVTGENGGRPEGTHHLKEERRLFDVAMSLATRKVVVKRPVHGAPIVQYVQPSHGVVSKNGRFDVYVVPP